MILVKLYKAYNKRFGDYVGDLKKLDKDKQKLFIDQFFKLESQLSYTGIWSLLTGAIVVLTLINVFELQSFRNHLFALVYIFILVFVFGSIPTLLFLWVLRGELDELMEFLIKSQKKKKK